MFKTFFIVLFSSFVSCDDAHYYRTFDYKTMEFIDPIEKNDYCVKLISKTADKIELEVIYAYNKVKRTFIKKDGYWYSKYKYKTVPVLGYAVKYGENFEVEYYIFENYIVYLKEDFYYYVDLNEKLIFYSTELIYKNRKLNLKNLDLEQIKKYDYKRKEYYTENETLICKRNSFVNGVKNEDGERIEETNHFADLDIFFWLDIEIYSPGAGVEPIYD